jgi:DNA repair protein RadC
MDYPVFWREFIISSHSITVWSFLNSGIFISILPMIIHYYSKYLPNAVKHALMYPKMREQKKEKFITLYLDTKNQILKEEVVSIGSLNASIVHPREVFKSALIESSASVIMVHNHPSGDPSPSREDIMVTEKLVEGGKLLGIDVLDHIIIGDGRYVSLKDEGFVR